MTGMRPMVDIMFGDFITLNDPKGLLKVSIRDDNPVALFEDKMMYQTKGHVPAEEYIIPLGQADIKWVGDDLTLVATSSMGNVALEAAEQHAELDISTEVVDPRTTLPLDQKTIIASAKKTSRAIVVDEGYQPYGVTAKIASVIADGAFLLSGCSRQTDGGYECAYSLLASIRGPNRTDSRAGHGISEGALRASIDR
jgi:pyruvate/2-oxoglutarate/acetoin dehydrogenase E1 component